jgi:hypothetical protein
MIQSILTLFFVARAGSALSDIFQASKEGIKKVRGRNASSFLR